MFRSLLHALAFGAALWVFSWLGKGEPDPVVRSIAAAAVGVSMTALVFGQWSFLPVSIGALSPLAFVLLERHSVALATSALCFFWNAPRLVLAPNAKRLVSLAVVLVAAAAAA